MSKEFVIHTAIEDQVGKSFRDKLEPIEIQKVLAHFGLEQAEPDIAFRLSFLAVSPEGRRNSHFQDAKEIAEIIDNVVPEGFSQEDLDKLRVACLLHDIGKAGPAEILDDEISQEDQLEMIEAFAILFNVDPHPQDYDGRSFQDVPFTEVLVKELGSEEGSRVSTLILKATALQKKKSAETMVKSSSSMGHVWAAHVYWTFDVLKMHNIDKRIVEIASSHHLLDGRNPARVNLENTDSSIASLEVVDKYQAYLVRGRSAKPETEEDKPVLESVVAGELADKYQAYIVRGFRTHEDTVKILREIVRTKLEKMPKTLEVYLRCIDSIEKNKDLLKREMELT